MFQGSMVALVTPMTKSGDIDDDAMLRLIDWHCEAGTDGLVILGSTGEAATLTAKERERIISQTVKRVNGLIPVIAGSGTNATQTTLDYTQQAKDLGVDAALICTPYYNKPTQAGLLAHFSAAADLGLPIILYNVPSRTAVDLLPETVISLAKHEYIVAIKESHSLERCLILLDLCDDDFLIISGDDANALPCIEAGGMGVISVAANIVPDLMHACIEAALSAEMPTALLLEEKMRPLFDALFVESNPIPVKYCLNRMGKIQPILRLPLTPLSLAYHTKLDTVLDNLGLLKGQKMPMGAKHG